VPKHTAGYPRWLARGFLAAAALFWCAWIASHAWPSARAAGRFGAVLGDGVFGTVVGSTPIRLVRSPFSSRPAWSSTRATLAIVDWARSRWRPTYSSSAALLTPAGATFTLRGVWVPLWPLAAAFTVAALWTGRLARRPLAPGGCPVCGYSLTGLTIDTCPECGQVVIVRDAMPAVHARR